METIRGKTSHQLDLKGLAERLAGYKHIRLDLGTGDGRYVCRMAEQHHDRFFIGVDACRENCAPTRGVSCRTRCSSLKPAQALPQELMDYGCHNNFPWAVFLKVCLQGPH